MNNESENNFEELAHAHQNGDGQEDSVSPSSASDILDALSRFHKEQQQCPEIGEDSVGVVVGDTHEFPSTEDLEEENNDDVDGNIEEREDNFQNRALEEEPEPINGDDTTEGSQKHNQDWIIEVHYSLFIN